MSSKYARLDEKLFAWLEEMESGITTSGAFAALSADTEAVRRHIARRISQLQAKKILDCEIQGTARVCTLVKPLPTTLAKERWAQRRTPKVMPRHYTPIPAANSEEFVANGGIIERLPAAWD